MIKIFRNNKYQNISLQEYLDIFHSQLPEDWENLLFHVNKALSIVDEKSLHDFLLDMNLKTFDFILMKDKYDYLRASEEMLVFDDDMIKFISYLYAIGYFEKIGNPNLDKWLNSKDINRPFGRGGDYSLLEVINLKNGDNAVRHKLLTTLKWI